MHVTSPSTFSQAAALHATAVLASDAFAKAPIKHILKGAPVFHEGDDAFYVYEILTGVVRSSKILRDCRRQIISFGYPGDLIGISHDNQYQSDCEALSNVTVRRHRYNANSTNAVLEPEFCNALIKHVATEMSVMQDHFMMLGRKTATEKVASFLCTLFERVSNKRDGRSEFELAMSRADIADFLGLTMETVSRTFTKFRKSGVILLHASKKIEVIDHGGLRALSEGDDFLRF
jgi:CRP-like cAMP-binding protein